MPSPWEYCLRSTQGYLPADASSSSATLLNHSSWSRFKQKGKELEDRHGPMLTLANGEFETLLTLPHTFNDLITLARDWAKPSPDAIFTLRVPVEYASIQAAIGGWTQLSSEDSYQITVAGVQGTRVEIVSDAPPPPEDELPIPPPVLEMPGFFDLELSPGQNTALNVTMDSDDLDMSHMEDGTLLDGKFWGKLEIVHSDDIHVLDFSGTRLPPGEDYGLDVNARVMNKLAIVRKPATAKCDLTILAPHRLYCDIVLTFSRLWKLGVTWPPPERLSELKIKYSLQIDPGRALEYFESEMAPVAAALYYEAIPDASMFGPTNPLALTPRNGFVMPLRDFVPHLLNVLDQLGVSLQARTALINDNISAFSAHQNIAYRFLAPSTISAAIDITATHKPCIFTRIFLIFRGLDDDEVFMFSGAGEKEANTFNWREIVGWSELGKDLEQFRVLETSVLEIT